MMPEWGHVFHTQWVDQWFATKHTNDINCPHCNIKLLTKEEIKEKIENEIHNNRIEGIDGERSEEVKSDHFARVVSQADAELVKC